MAPERLHPDRLDQSGATILIRAQVYSGDKSRFFSAVRYIYTCKWGVITQAKYPAFINCQYVAGTPQSRIG